MTMFMFWTVCLKEKPAGPVSNALRALFELMGDVEPEQFREFARRAVFRVAPSALIGELLARLVIGGWNGTRAGGDRLAGRLVDQCVAARHVQDRSGRTGLVVDLHRAFVDDHHGDVERHHVFRVGRLAGSAIEQENQIVADLLAVARVHRVDRDRLKPCRRGEHAASFKPRIGVERPHRATGAKGQRRKQRKEACAAPARKALLATVNDDMTTSATPRSPCVDFPSRRIQNEIERASVCLFARNLVRVAGNHQVAMLSAFHLNDDLVIRHNIWIGNLTNLTKQRLGAVAEAVPIGGCARQSLCFSQKVTAGSNRATTPHRNSTVQILNLSHPSVSYAYDVRLNL